MIFLTNKSEIYAAILRNTVTKLILKNGQHTKYLKMLKKIHSFESLLCKDLTPVNIKKSATEILSCVHIKKVENNRLFSFSVDVRGNFIINKKAFLSLVLSLSENADFLNIKNFKNGIFIKCNNPCVTKHLKLITKKLNAVYFFERKNSIMNVLLFPTATNKKSRITAKDRDSFRGPLSVINYYLDQ